MSDPMPNGQVRLTIDDQVIDALPGRMLIDVAEEHGVFVPRFCYHPGLESVAACRMCLVEIEGGKRPLEPACSTQIAEGMVVHTKSETAEAAQKAVLEMLLINHPLDCPICDRGGECPLQDQTMAFGPGTSRYMEEKRHFKKPLPISDLVLLDRERCVLCWRCVRFCDEVSGDRFIDLMDRGSHTQINVAEEKPFDSYFSGNTIQICPVGALTSSSYRFLSRPWDLKKSSTVCSHCSVGCPISLEHRDGEVLRAQALPNEEVNSFWNCDKGRFGHRYVSHPQRLRSPSVRQPSGMKPASWTVALDRIAKTLKEVAASSGPQAIGLIGGSRATNEDLYAAATFFRETIGTSNLDFRTFDAEFPYEHLAVAGFAGSTASLNDLDDAGVILWVGPDPREELPVLYLRIRRAVERGAALLILNPRRISISPLGTHLPVRPGHEADLLRRLRDPAGASDARLDRARAALSKGPLVACIGQSFVGRSSQSVAWELRHLVQERDDAKILVCVPNANSQGAIDMGLSPYLATGHHPHGAGWSTVEMLKATITGGIRFLWIMGSDLSNEVPDAELVGAALRAEAFIVVSEMFPTDATSHADVVLPVESFAEKEGSFTNLERRVQKLDPAVSAPGVARPEWRIFAELSTRFDVDRGWRSSRDIAYEITAKVGTHVDANWDSLAVQKATSFDAQTSTWPLSWELRAIDATSRTGVIWSGPGAIPPPPKDDPELVQASASPVGFPLVLLVGRSIYDGGQMVSRSPELGNVMPDPMVEIHPDEARARGLSAGNEVVVRSSNGELRVLLKVSEDTPPGAAFMFQHVKDVVTNVLMRAGTETFVEVSS